MYRQFSFRAFSPTLECLPWGTERIWVFFSFLQTICFQISDCTIPLSFPVSVFSFVYHLAKRLPQDVPRAWPSHACLGAWENDNLHHNLRRGVSLYPHHHKLQAMSSRLHFITFKPLIARVVERWLHNQFPPIFLFSTVPWDLWTPGLSIPWCCLPTTSVCLVFFPLSLYLARWFWPVLHTASD